MADPTPQEDVQPPASEGKYLKLAPNFFVLTGVLVFIIGTKILLLRETTLGDFGLLAAFAVVLVIVPYLGAWLVWSYTGRKQRNGEIAFVVITALLFMIPTVALYREAFAAQ